MNFRVGDRVWSALFGWGTVDEILPDNSHPIKVIHIGRTVTYTMDGRYLKSHLRPILFFNEVAAEDWPSPPKPKPDLTSLKMNQPILVKFIANGNFARRLFAFTDGTHVWYFANGADSRGARSATRAEDWKPISGDDLDE